MKHCRAKCVGRVPIKGAGAVSKCLLLDKVVFTDGGHKSALDEEGSTGAASMRENRRRDRSRNHVQVAEAAFTDARGHAIT